MQIDILLITYNQEQYIQKALDGILMQQVHLDVQLRIVVADDCSRDNTLPEIKNRLGDVARLDNGVNANVIYLPNESNMGHVRNYQRAFAACEGDFIAILEGDDYWTDVRHIQIHIDFLQIHKECVLTTQRPIWYFEDENRFVPSSYVESEEQSHRYVTLDNEIRSNKIINLSSCLIRTDAIHQLDERVFGCSVLDWPLYVNLSQLGLLCILPGTSNVYRAKSSGLYAGLNKEEEIQKDLLLLSEIEEIFPQYASYYKEARTLIIPKKKSFCRKIVECVLWPFVMIGRLFTKIEIVYREQK